MKTLTIHFSDEAIRQIEEIARRLDLSPEDLVRSTVEEKINKFDADFERAAEYVLAKNAELYRRLA